MNSLVTKKEEKAIKKLLSLGAVPEVTLSYYELRGYLYGIAITPVVIQPAEWLPVIFSEEAVMYASEDQAKELTGTLFSVLNKHIAAFQRKSLFMPFNMESLKEEDFEKIFDWTSGFEEALSLRPECWEEHDELGKEEQDHLMNSLVVIEGIVYPEDAVDMFDHIPRKELLKIGVNLSGSDINKVMQIQFFMLQALELSIETIQAHAYALETQRKEEHRTSATPLVLKSSSGIGKNAECPCGSGKKFQDCCSLPSAVSNASSEGKNKQGKLIKVDFTQNGKDKKIRKKAKGNESGHIYQLEITLAYSKPEIWRRIQLPSSTLLSEFHKVIQLAMGWQDTHMHQYQAGLKFYGPQLADDYSDKPILDESRFTLAELESELVQGIVYTYDFGDNWEHVIMLEKVLPETEGKHFPVVLDGARACPPEDIGGIPMYQEYLAFLAGSEDQELKEMFDIPSLKDYDPDFFNAEALNQFFQSIYSEK